MGITNPYARQLMHQLLDKGLSIAEIATAARTREALIKQGLAQGEKILLSMDQYLHLVNWVAKRFNNEAAYGMHLANHDEGRDLGIFSSLINNSSTVREGILVMSHYVRLLSPGVELAFEETDKSGFLVYRLLERSTECARHDVEYTFASVVKFLHPFPRDTWWPLRVNINCRPPDDLTQQRALFGNQLSYNPSDHVLEFNADVLDLPLGKTNPQLMAIMKSEANRILDEWERSSDLRNQVRMIIMNDLQTGNLNSERVAKTLHLSRATMHRRLVAESTTYQQLRDEIVEELARKALATEAPISEIAQMLGYSEHSAFDHAFTRISGVTPSEYRRSL